MSEVMFRIESYCSALAVAMQEISSAVWREMSLTSFIDSAVAEAIRLTLLTASTEAVIREFIRGKKPDLIGRNVLRLDIDKTPECGIIKL